MASSRRHLLRDWRAVGPRDSSRLPVLATKPGAQEVLCGQLWKGRLRVALADGSSPPHSGFCCCVHAAFAKATGGLQIAVSVAITLFFIPVAFSTLTFLEHFLLLASVSLPWFSTYSLEAIYNLLFLLSCLCSLLSYAPTMESAVCALISGFSWRGRVLRDHSLGARGVFFFFK